nr:hypothetical protein Iba_chr06bCG15260 [Ipomoea batatas]
MTPHRKSQMRRRSREIAITERKLCEDGFEQRSQVVRIQAPHLHRITASHVWKMTCWVLRPFFGKTNRGAADEFSANKETTDGDGLGSSATGFGCFSLFAGLAIGGSGLLCLGWERGGVAPVA